MAITKPIIYLSPHKLSHFLKFWQKFIFQENKKTTSRRTAPHHDVALSKIWAQSDDGLKIKKKPHVAHLHIMILLSAKFGLNRMKGYREMVRTKV